MKTRIFRSLSIIGVILGCTALVYGKDSNMGDKNMDEMKDFKSLEKLESHVINLDISKNHKETILKVIEFEKDFCKRQVFLELGKQSFETMQKEEK